MAFLKVTVNPKSGPDAKKKLPGGKYNGISLTEDPTCKEGVLKCYDGFGLARIIKITEIGK